VERYLKLAETTGARITFPLRFPLPTGDPLPRFDDYPPFVLLHPFARGSGKSLSDRTVEEFCCACAPTRVVVVGKSKLRGKIPENCVDLTNQTTLLQLVWLIRKARFTISVDSGPMHIAAAITTNLVAIHTWTDPRRVGPYNAAAWIWRSGELRQMRDFPAGTKLPKGRAFRRADIATVTQLVGDLWGPDPG
jgi:ADP-heptose:LPS heptosyltransferase